MTALARGRAALDTITSGEWNYHRDDADGLRYIHDMDTGDMCVDITANGSGSSVEDADLEFIAAAPGLVRDLCDELENAVGERDAWRGASDAWRKKYGTQSDKLAQARAERDAALATIERVRAMHQKEDFNCPNECCDHCDHCQIPWPCATIQALGDQ